MFEFELKYWAGSIADVPRGSAQKITILISNLHKLNIFYNNILANLRATYLYKQSKTAKNATMPA